MTRSRPQDVRRWHRPEAVLFVAAVCLVAAGRAVATPAPAPRCDDATFLRRATLDLAGRQPTAGEVAAFVADTSAAKRTAAIDRLLADPDWARTWARYFRDVILYRRTDDRALLMAGPLEEHLARRLRDAPQWDEIATEFITATGVPAEQGAVAIVMAQMGETADIAAEMSRIFLGIQIQCAQCHDHFTDRWKRPQFHEFAAFFPRIAIRRGPGEGLERFEVASFDRAPRAGRRMMADNPRRGDLEHEMPDADDPSRPGTVMTPRFFLTGASVPQGTPDQERRGALAGWITSAAHPWFDRALVNRIWAELMGAGFYRGVDDIGPDREPEPVVAGGTTLDALAAGFRTSGHDLRWLFRTIATSPEYQRAARSRSDPDRAAFAANCPQRLRADQLFNQVLAALAVDESRAAAGAARRRGPQGQAGGRRQVAGPRALFGQVFGYDPSLPREEVVGSIPQALLLMNSQPLAVALDGDRRFTVLGGLLREHDDDRAVADALYLRTLARPPTPAEMQACLDHVRAAGDRAEGFEDVFWALLNSAEFIHRQ
jgi:hypothetical protein